MLAYAHVLGEGEPAEREAREVAEARRTQRDARAEAQLTGRQEVLDLESEVNVQLAKAYRLLRKAERATGVGRREPLAKDAIRVLEPIMPMMGRVRVAMRMDLGTIDKPPAWY